MISHPEKRIREWDHNSHYLPYLLGCLPQPCVKALDVGCGTGEFARLLAPRSGQVIGLDFSPKMIEQARAESTDFPNISYVLDDFLEYEWPQAEFDAIASVATVHHLPLFDP